MASQLHDFISKCEIENIELILSQGVTYHVFRETYGYTPLHLAAERGFYAGVNLLLTKEADINVTDECGNTPLYSATRMLNTEMFRHLVERGADVNHRNKHRETPLHCAAATGIVGIIELLHNKQAELDVYNDDGNTPLHLSCIHKRLEAVEYLLDAGALVNPINKLLETPLHIVAQNGFVEAVTILLKKGADVCAVDKYSYTPLTSVVRNQSRYDSYECVEKTLFKMLDWATTMHSRFTYAKLFSSIDIDHRHVVYDIRQKHIIKFVKLRDAHLSFRHAYVLLGFKDFLFQLKCHKEVEKIVTTRFGSFSLYDLYFKQFDLRYVSNLELEQAIWSSNFENQFPIYAPLIQAEFFKYRKRRDLFLSAVERLQDLLQRSTTIGELYVPNEILHMILLFVDDGDLKNVINS